MPVIDASVYVALIKADEPDHDKSWAWFEQAIAAKHEIVAPVILMAEVAAALSRGVGDAAWARRVQQHVGRHWLTGAYGASPSSHAS